MFIAERLVTIEVETIAWSFVEMVVKHKFRSDVWVYAVSFVQLSF